MHDATTVRQANAQAVIPANPYTNPITGSAGPSVSDIMPAAQQGALAGLRSADMLRK